MPIKCFHSGKIIYSIYWLVLLAYVTYIYNIIFFSNVKSSRAESSEQLRTCKIVLLKGILYKEITVFLPNQHSIDISLRQLHQLLHQQNLYHKDTVNVALEAIKAGIDGTSTNLCYRSIHQKLKHNGTDTEKQLDCV